MQKALQQMNLQLGQVLSDITGTSGLAIIQAILDGERDPAKLLTGVNRRVQASNERILKALVGDYRPEHLFVLRQACELYHTYEEKIGACDEQIAQETARLPDKVDVKIKPLPARKAGRRASLDVMGGQDLRPVLYSKFGVDLTAIEGIGVVTALVLLTEIGPCMDRFPTEKHFCSWLGLCPDNRISGGKVLSSRTRRVVNRAADALRMSATTLQRSQSALGGYFRRMKARLGAAEAVTATGHKLARLVYRLLKHGEAYVSKGMEQYEKQFRERRLSNLRRAATALGLELVEKQAPQVIPQQVIVQGVS